MFLSKIRLSACLFLLSFACIKTAAREDHILLNDEYIGVLKDLAQKVSLMIDERYPHQEHVIIGLGQSPAYLLEMIKLLDTQKGRTDREYLHVAFSGRFLPPFVDEYADPIYRKKLKTRYKNYLTELMLDKKHVDRSKKKHIILEFCYQGTGLQSFLNFFKKYTNKPDVIYLRTMQAESLYPILLQGVASSKVILDDPKTIRLACFLSNSDEYDDRLVPHFSPRKWPNVDPLVFTMSDQSRMLLKRMKCFVDNTSKDYLSLLSIHCGINSSLFCLPK